jgi:uncharacterized protein (TIGR02391 family)
MIDFHTLRSQIKRQLLAQAQRLDVSADPMSWAWLARAFASDGMKNNPSLGQALDQARRWLADETIWQQDGNLGSIGLFFSLLHQAGDVLEERHIATLESHVARLCEQVPGRFAKLSNPDFAFGLAYLAQAYLSSALQQRLGEHYRRLAQAENIRLAVLLAAAADVLGTTVRPLVFDVATLSAHEVIPLVWLVERHPSLIDGNARRNGVWEAYERLKDGIALDEQEVGSGALHIAIPTDLAMLYEAVVSKTNQTDFVALFNNMPWHPAIRAAAGSLFLKGEYVAAVFEAAKLFIDEVKHRASNPHDSAGKPLDGGPLITYTFGGKTPRLKFTTLSNQTEQNEHRGLTLIAEGIVSALRNPKGHLPGMAITLTPEEALEQLATISYLMRRLDAATT